MAKKAEKSEDTKLWAFLVMFLSTVGIAIAYLAGKHKDQLVVHYMKQHMGAGILIGALAMVIGLIPILGWIVMIIIGIAAVILWFIGWIYALSGEKKYLPFIGKYAEELFSGF